MNDRDSYLNRGCNPYIGLRNFEERDRRFFKGRRHHVVEILKRLTSQRFLAVIGPSGSGKSSLVLAGVLPALRADRLPGSGSEWILADMRPAGSPLQELSKSLMKGFREYFNGDANHEEETGFQERIYSVLREFGSTGLGEALKVQPLDQKPSVLLVVDQFEELFRFREANEQRGDAELFISQLLFATGPKGPSNLFVIITMRSDFLGNAAGYLGLAEAINNGMYLIPRLERHQIVEAIELPARECGGRISDSLVPRLANDIIGEQDVLPLLQHALMRCWNKTDYPSEETYDQQGGKRALQEHLNNIYFEHESKGHGTLVERLFKRLTKVGDLDTVSKMSFSDAGVRDSATLLEISEETGYDTSVLASVIDTFRGSDESFLRPSIDELKTLSEKSTIDITHESIIRRWDKLGGTDQVLGWLQEEFEAKNNWLNLQREAKAAELADKPRILPEGIVDIYLGLESTTWTENWSRRYSSRATDYRLAVNYLHKCKEFHATVREAEKNELDRKLREQEAEAAKQKRRARNVLVAAISSFVVLACVAALTYRGLRWGDEATTSEAEQLMSVSSDLAANGGSYSQERSAFLLVASRMVKPTQSNSDLTAWRQYQRLRQPEATFSNPGELTKQISFLAFSPNSDKRLITRGIGGDGKIQTISIRKDGSNLVSDQTSEGREIIHNVGGNLLSDDGLFSVRACKSHQSRMCVVAITTGGEIFSTKFPGTPKVINNSANSKTIVVGYESSVSSNLVLEGCSLDQSGQCANRLGFEVPAEIEELRAGMTIDLEVSNSGKLAFLRFGGPPNKKIRLPAAMLHEDSERSKILSAKMSKDTQLRPFVAAKAANLILQNVVDAKFSADDRYIAIGFDPLNEKASPLVIVDELTSGKSAAIVHARSIAALAFSRESDSQTRLVGSPKPHDVLLASASADGELRLSAVKQTEDGGVSAPLIWSDAVPLAPNVIEFNPKNELLAVGSSDKTARVYDVASGTEVTRVTHKASVQVVAFDHSGTTVASGDLAGTVALFPAVASDSYRQVVGIPCDAKSVPVGAKLGDSARVVGVECASTQFEGKAVLAPTGLEPRKSQFGIPLVVSQERSTSQCSVVVGHGSAPSVYSICPDTISMSSDPNWKHEMFGTVTAAAAGKLGNGQEVLVVSSMQNFSSDLGRNTTLEVYSPTSTKAQCTSTITGEVRTIAFGNDTLAIGTADSRLLIYSTNKGLCSRNELMIYHQLELGFPRGPAITAIAFDRTTRYVGIGTESMLAVYEISSRQLVAWSRQKRTVTSVAFDSTGSLFASGSQSGDVSVIQLPQQTAERNTYLSFIDQRLFGTRSQTMQPVEPLFNLHEQHPVFDVAFADSESAGRVIKSLIIVTLANIPLFAPTYPHGALYPNSIAVSSYGLVAGDKNFSAQDIMPSKICNGLKGNLAKNDWYLISKRFTSNTDESKFCQSLENREQLEPGIPYPEWALPNSN